MIKALYGMPTSGDILYSSFGRTLCQELGFSQSECDSALHVGGVRFPTVQLVTFVDDLLVDGSAQELDRFWDALHAHFTFERERGPPDQILAT